MNQIHNGCDSDQQIDSSKPHQGGLHKEQDSGDIEQFSDLYAGCEGGGVGQGLVQDDAGHGPQDSFAVSKEYLLGPEGAVEVNRIDGINGGKAPARKFGQSSKIKILHNHPNNESHNRSDNVIHFSKDQIALQRDGKITRKVSYRGNEPDRTDQMNSQELGSNFKGTSFKLKNRKVNVGKEDAKFKTQLRDDELQEWMWLQTKTQYDDEAMKNFSSLKYVLHSRHQYSKVGQERKKEYDKFIDNKDKEKFKQVYINVSDSLKNRQNREDNGRDPRQEESEEGEKQSCWQQYHNLYVNSIAHVKDERTFFIHGKVMRFGKNSLGILSNKSKFRWTLVWLTQHKLFENTTVFLILLNSLFLGIKDYTDKENKTDRNRFVEEMEPFFTWVFAGECVSKIVAQGWILGANSYLTDAWNWLDFIVVVTAMMQQIPSMRGMSGLRTFRLFRPLRSLTTMPSMKILIETLLSSVSQLGGIMGLALFFFLIFAILGVSLWDGKIHYRCYETQWPDPITGAWNTVEGDNRLCSEDNRQCVVGYCNSRYVAYDLGKFPQNWTEQMANLNRDVNLYELNYGITCFDDIMTAFLTIFQCITMEGWTKIMNIYEDCYSRAFVVLYFISCVIICAFFLLNLTIAVMLMKYEELDKSHSNSDHNNELRELGLRIKLPVDLTEFLIKQDSIIINSEANKLLKKEDSFFKQLFAKKEYPLTDQDRLSMYYQNPLIKLCRRIIEHPYFDSSIILVIIINTLCLGMEKYPRFPDEIMDTLQTMNYIFTAIFTIEVVFKMIGLGLRYFIREKFNIFDLLIVLISYAEMYFQQGSGSSSVFSSFRAIRLFKIFKLFQVGDLRILIDSIAFTLTTIGDYVILLLLFVYVFALLGMSFFAGNVKFDEDDNVDLVNGEPPRENFDSLEWSVITIFEVMMGEGWNDLMYNVIRSVHGLGSLYFIFLVMLGNIIMLNLFLAILLGNFDKARSFGQKKKVFEAFKEMVHDNTGEEQRSLGDALDLILGDMSQHVKTKILKWDKNQVKKMHEKGDTGQAKEMLEDGQMFMPGDDDKVNSNLMSIHKKHKSIIKTNETIVPGKQKSMSRGRSPVRREKGNQRENGTIEQRRKRKRSNRYGKTVEKYHKTNKKILRMRELNRMKIINPFKGLKEILEKKVSLEDTDLLSVDSLNYKGYRGLKNQHITQSIINFQKLKLQQMQHEERMDLRKNRSKSIDESTALQNNAVFRVMQHGLAQQASEDFMQKSPDQKLNQANQNLGLSILNRSGKNKQVSINLSNQSRKDFINTELQKEESLSMKQKFPDEIDELDDELAHQNCIERFFSRLPDSSLFIFYKKSKIRQWCMKLAEPPENLMIVKLIEKAGSYQAYLEEQEEKAAEAKEYAHLGMNREQIMRAKLVGDKKDQGQQPFQVFENIILVLILLSSILLVLDNPTEDPNGLLMTIVGLIDIGFTCLFTIEASIKIIAKGLLFNRLGPIKPYLRDVWNILDAVVVAASLSDLIFLILEIDMSQLSALKALRAFRGLRPLRVISKNPGMKLVVNALLASIPSMTNVLIVCALIILIFAIMGVNFFKGTFYSCQPSYDPDAPKLNYDKIETEEDCKLQGGRWVNQNQNFDNSMNAMLTLFEMMTTEGWTQVMYSGIDNRGIGIQPKTNSSIGLIVYFIIFMIIGSQFIINLFVGVVIDNFNTIKEKEELDNMFVTEEQRMWIEIQKVGQGKKLRRKIDEPEGFRIYFFKLVNHRYFEAIINLFIVCNTVLMAIKHYRMSQTLKDLSEQSNYVFAVVFNMEMILKLIGLGKIYFYSMWNNFDMIIVFATDFGILLKVLQLNASFQSAATVIRGFRIMRMFKLIRSSVHMRLILDTVFNILPQISNVMQLIFLMFFIYAALGINLFSGVMLQDNLDSKNNFQNFHNALIILMKFSTGEDWNAYMYELANSEGYGGKPCLDVQTYADIVANNGEMNQCGTIISFAYFLSFTVLVSMLIMNLSVAAVIEGLDTARKENMGIVAGDEIDELIDLWQQYDEKATGWISKENLIFLLYELPPPLGKPLEKLDVENVNETNKKGDQSKKDRFLVCEERDIVIRKIDAMEILRNLRIKSANETYLTGLED